MDKAIDIFKWIFMFVWGPIAGMGLLIYILIWTVPVEIYKKIQHRKQPKPAHELPIQKLIDQVKEENKPKTTNNDWSSA